MNDSPILKVAVNVPLSRAFDYLPARDSEVPQPGCRVLVPFGRRRQTGLVLAHARHSELPAGKIRRSIATLDSEPLLRADDLRLLRFASDYYHHPIGEVVATALPALLRQGKPLYPEIETLAVAADAEGTDAGALGRRAPRQAGLLELLQDAGGNGIDAATLNELLPNWRRIAKPLIEKGLVLRYTTRGDRPSVADAAPASPGPELNSDQRRALEAIRGAAGYGTFLLDGVTGSGKTEIYLRLLRDVIARGKQALVLAPEIGLTPQLVARFRDRLGIEPAVLHSGLGDAERLRAWREARSGAAPLIVGTRSAVFTP
ncbi:MAG: DEAD/DEAH box helicase, partial [Woeseiaceae bacterium]